MDIGWYVRRLRRMSVAEIAWRGRSAAIQQSWRLGTPRGPAPGALKWSGAALPAATPDIDPAASARLLAAADAVIGGHWHVFGLNFDTAPADPDWHRDARTGLRFDPQRYCFDVPYRRPELVGNVKSIWEPSRLYHVTLLAAAYRISGEVRYARHAADHLRSWWRRNPPLRGIHWISGIELGMRLIAWVWTRRLLADWPEAPALFEENGIFARQLYQHERWLAALYSRGSSGNNHLIAEAVGLFVATTAFAGTPQRERWATLAAGILEQEALSQTFPDGLNRELAFSYHGFVLGLLLVAAIEGEAGGRPMSDDYWRTLTRMADALAANVGAGMVPPRQGDGDDAHALLLDAPETGPWLPMLDLCSVLFGRRDWWPASSGRFALSALVAPLASGRGQRASDARPGMRPNRFPDAGITFLRGTPQTPSVLSCRIDHGPLGYLSTCAHGHADALAFELSIDGHPLLVDPGTYCYQGEPEWRRYFRSTIAHNTLEMEGADQAIQTGPFLWSGQPTSWVESEDGIDEGDAAEITVAHDGYRRLEAKATHFRRYRLDRRAGALAITDWIEAEKPVSVRLAFQLPPNATLECSRHAAVICVNQERIATLALPAALAWSHHRGADNPPLGWYSPEFGVRVPATSLIGSGTLAPGEKLETCLQADVTHTSDREVSAISPREVDA